MMPTWRKLHVKTTESLDLNDMPDDFTRLLWVMLPLGLDAEGRGLDYPAWVRSKVLPLREDVRAKKIEAALLWYEERGMIERYRQNGRRYFHIPTWRTYQGDTKRERPSDFPGPTLESLTTSSRLAHDQRVQESCLDADIDVDVDVEAEADLLPLLCPIHGVELTRFTKGNDVWHSHRQGDGWCKPKLPPRAPTGQDFISGKFGDSIQR